MRVHQDHVHLNMHAGTYIFFGCGVINFNEKKLRELKRIYEITVIRKLGVGDKFPRKLLRAQKTVLGV